MDFQKKKQSIFRGEYKNFISEYYSRKGIGKVIEETFETFEVDSNTCMNVLEIKVKLLEEDIIEVLFVGDRTSFKVTSNGEELYNKNIFSVNELELVTKNTKSRIHFMNYFENIDKILNKKRNKFDYI